MKKFLTPALLLVIFAISIPYSVSAKHRQPFFAKSSKNISLVCEKRCPFPKQKLQKAFAALNAQFIKMEEKVGTPFPENLKPVEIHLRYDASCRKISKERTDDQEVFGFTTAKPDGKAMICMKADIDDIIKNRPTHLLHEYAHHYFPMQPRGKHDFEETLAAAFEQFITGKPNSFCDAANEKSEPNLYKLCRDFGFEVDDMPTLIARLQALKKNADAVTNRMAIDEIKRFKIMNYE
ncbi:hypothetical protein HYW83_01565 [Candidatus Peregrinibacteria bacterium]|nr:hypothetical protein [Candidatus Peregrinibacteria bacterium]